MKRIFTLAASAVMVALAFVGCQKNPGATPDSEAIRFTSSIAGMNVTETRAADAAWHTADAIGIFMHDGSGYVGSNAHHTTAASGANGTFVAADTSHELYLEDGATADFIAYYPYKSTLNQNQYTIDLTSQSDHKLIDLMYSDNVTGHTEGDAALVFEHRLSRVVFNVTDLDGVSLVGMTAQITGVNTNATFDILENSIDGMLGSNPFNALVSASAIQSEATADAIVLPGDYTGGYTVTFTIGDYVGTLEMPSVTYTEGNMYVYDVELKTAGTEYPSEPVLVGGTGTIQNWNTVPGTSYEVEKVGTEEPATPSITAVSPTSLSFANIGGSKTVTATVSDQGTATLSVSGLSGPLSAAVSGNTVTVTATANSAQTAINQTMTISVSGGNSVTVPVTVAAAPPVETPSITAVNPTNLSFANTGGQQTVSVTVADKGSNSLSVSGLSGILSASVNQTTNVVTVTATVNTATNPVTQTMTVSLGSSSKTVTVTVAAATPPPAQDIVTDFTLTAGTPNETPFTLTKDGIAITSSQGSHSNTIPRYWNDNNHGLEIRTYSGNTITFTKSGGTLTKIEFLVDGVTVAGTLSANTGSFSGNVWTGSANSVTFAVIASGQGSGSVQYHFLSVKTTSR